MTRPGAPCFDARTAFLKGTAFAAICTAITANVAIAVKVRQSKYGNRWRVSQMMCVYSESEKHP